MDPARFASDFGFRQEQVCSHVSGFVDGRELHSLSLDEFRASAPKQEMRLMMAHSRGPHQALQTPVLPIRHHRKRLAT
jgi:hypothetical protein